MFKKVRRVVIPIENWNKFEELCRVLKVKNYKILVKDFIVETVTNEPVAHLVEFKCGKKYDIFKVMFDLTSYEI